MDTVLVDPIDGEKMIFELKTHFDINVLKAKYFKNHKNLISLKEYESFHRNAFINSI